MASTTAEIQWIKYILRDLKEANINPTLLFCDNNSEIHIAKNSVFHERTKHLDIACHFVRATLQAGIIHRMAVSSKNQLAYLLTKSLHTPDFSKQTERL